ncbi:prolactin-like [Menidia menidia]
MRVGTAPICSSDGQAGCHVPPLADLFDRVIQQSSRMHGISSDLHSEFEQYFFPSGNIIGKRRCHTYDIITPDDKENAQRLGPEQLTEVILRLLVAWSDPLLPLPWSTLQDQSEDFNPQSYSKALEIPEMVDELKDGVQKMAERMKLEGVLGNTVGYISADSLVPSSTVSFYGQGELSPLYHHHDIFYCLRRDSSKVKSYLRILKCTTLPELDC